MYHQYRYHTYVTNHLTFTHHVHLKHTTNKSCTSLCHTNSGDHSARPYRQQDRDGHEHIRPEEHHPAEGGGSIGSQEPGQRRTSF